MSLPLKSEPLAWVTISIAPLVPSLTQAAKALAFSLWKLVSG